MQSWRGKTNTGWLSCTSRAVLKLYLFFFFNVWIVNKLRLVSFELGPRENLDIDINCFVDTSVRCHAVMRDRIWMHLAGHTDHRQLLCITAVLLRKGSHNNKTLVLILLPASTAWPLHVVLPVRKGWACWIELPLEFPWVWTCHYTSKTFHPCALVRFSCSCLTQPHRNWRISQVAQTRCTELPDCTHTGQMTFLWIVIEFRFFSARGFHIYQLFHQSHGCEWWASVQGAWLAPHALSSSYINGIYLEPSSHGHKLNWIPGGSNLQKQRNVKGHL